MAKVKNVLVVMCDHHRFDALGCMGNVLARTPNLDALAERSVRFDRCYTQSPLCAPARHSLATGRYVHAHGVTGNSANASPGMVTLGHALQPLGYRRINIGHMHWRCKDDEHGYEPWIRHRQWRDDLSEKMRARADWEAHGITRRTTGGPGPRTRRQHGGHCVKQAAIEQMTAAVEAGEPFLCWAAFSEPHPPFYPPKDLYERVDVGAIELPAQAPADAPPVHPYVAAKRTEWAHLTETEVRQIVAGYYGMVALADEYIGQVLESLDRLGIRDETAVLWTVDHGDQMWEHELFLKWVMYEGATHVPLLIDVPGGPAGVRNELVEHVDIMPTICELLGAEVPASVQGRSLTPLLGGEPAPDDWRDAVFSQVHGHQMIRTKDWKLNCYDGEQGELYDLRSDPQEFYNRLDDPSCRDTVASLGRRLNAWREANRD